MLHLQLCGYLYNVMKTGICFLLKRVWILNLYAICVNICSSSDKSPLLQRYIVENGTIYNLHATYHIHAVCVNAVSFEHKRWGHLIGCHVFTAIADFEQRWRQSKNCKLKLQEMYWSIFFSIYLWLCCTYICNWQAQYRNWQNVLRHNKVRILFLVFLMSSTPVTVVAKLIPLVLRTNQSSTP